MTGARSNGWLHLRCWFVYIQCKCLVGGYDVWLRLFDFITNCTVLLYIKYYWIIIFNTGLHYSI